VAKGREMKFRFDAPVSTKNPETIMIMAEGMVFRKERE